jgi:DNA-binding FrmR family transcriptional regulator
LDLLDDHTHRCVAGAEDRAQRNKKTAELMVAVGRLMRRG